MASKSIGICQRCSRTWSIVRTYSNARNRLLLGAHLSAARLCDRCWKVVRPKP